MVDEIEYWQKKSGVINFSFYDDALLVKPAEMIIPLLKEIKKRNLSCQFHCPNGLHLREINKELSVLLYNSGFKTIRFGFETSDLNRQIQTGGKVKNKELRLAVSHLKNAGYKTGEIGIYLLCGIPGQSAEEVKNSMEFVRECGAKPVLAEYSPIPGTKMWDEAVAVHPLTFKENHYIIIIHCSLAGTTDFSFAAYAELKKKLKNN